MRLGWRVEGPGGRAHSDVVVPGQEAGVDIDLGEVEELEGNFGELVLLGSGSQDVGVDQFV